MEPTYQQITDNTMENVKATAEHIGKILYPIDNSWIFEVKEGEEISHDWKNDIPSLAGNLYDQSSKPCLIISGSFWKEFFNRISARMVEREFVMVKYEGRIFGVLNRFTTESVNPKVDGFYHRP